MEIPTWLLWVLSILLVIFILFSVGAGLYLYEKWGENCQTGTCKAATALASIVAAPLYSPQWGWFWMRQYADPNAPIISGKHYLSDNWWDFSEAHFSQGAL